MSQEDDGTGKTLVMIDGSRALRNPRDERFCQEAVATNSLERAYELAGFRRPRGNAQRKARDPKVAARLAFLWREAAESAALMGGRLLAKADVIAHANILDFFDVDAANGARLTLNLNKAPHAVAGAIQEISFDSNGKPKLKLHDSAAMLRFLIERGDPKNPAAAGDTYNLTVNQQLLAMVQRYESMSDTDVARRIAFSLQLGQRALQAASSTQTETPT